MFVGNVYLPPNGSPLLQKVGLQDRVGEIEGLLQSLPQGAPIFMGGDFNAHVDCVATSATAFATEYVGKDVGGRTLISMAIRCGLYLSTGRVEGDNPAQSTYRATVRSTSSRPDHILVSNAFSTSLSSISVERLLRGSDHYPLIARLELRLNTPLLRNSTHSGDTIVGIKWQEQLRIPFVQSLEEAPNGLQISTALAQEGKIAEALGAFTQTLLASAHDAGMPSRPWGNRIQRTNKPFYNGECYELKREWRKAGKLQGFQSPAVKTLERQYHSFVRSRKRSWLLNQLKDCISLYNTCPRRFWQTFRGAVPGLPGPLLYQEAWEGFLHHMIHPDPLALHLQPSQLSPLAYPWVMGDSNKLNEPFTLAELELGLTRLNTGKSNGFLGFPSELLRFAQRPHETSGETHPHLLAPTLLVLLNGLFLDGTIPVGFNVSRISPVVKDVKKNVLDIGNYRPIAVPEPLMRLFAVLLNERLVKYLDSINYRCQAQVGFRAGFSTLHQLFTLQHFIDGASRDEPLYCIKMDLVKAYDTVPRHLLWEAVGRSGVHGNFMEALQSVYEDGELSLSVGGTYGKREKAGSGITQGSPLSPTLFGIYFDGYIRYVEATCSNAGPCTRDGRHVPILAFADDSKALCRNLAEGQLILRSTSEWCDMTHMAISPIKTHAIAFPECAKDTLGGAFTYKGHPLELVAESRHLGVVFSSTAGMGATFPSLHGRMKSSWDSIDYKYGNLKCAASIGLFLKVFLTCVVPTASYACELWGWRKFPTHGSKSTARTLENEFLVMLRKIAGVRRTTRTDILLAELGVRPLKLQWLKRTVTFWNGLVDLPHDHLYAQVLRDSCYYGVTSHSPSWAGAFMMALRSIGYPYPIDCRKPYRVDLDAFREALKAAHKLPTPVHNSPRLAPRDPLVCTYAKWFGQPSSLQRRRLLYLPLNVKRVRTFIRFRLGVHHLPIDRGRQHRIPRDQRTCDMCNSAVGDEHHFIFHCQALAPLREQFSWLFSSGSYSLQKFVWQADLEGVVNFVYEAFKLRSQLLGIDGFGSSQV